MKLRWKHFLVLLVVSLAPLLAVTWISQNASRRLGKTISGRARNVLADEVRQSMVTAARSYAEITLRGGLATELALQVLAAKAELALSQSPPARAKIYFSADFDDPKTAPPDLLSSAIHVIHSKEGVVSQKKISRNHPNFLLAPGTRQADVAEDIARFTRLDYTLKDINRRFGHSLYWIYASLENGVHISYPGHGGYPKTYDPRKRPWYMLAKARKTIVWSPPIVDATTGQFLLTVSMPFRRPDGSLAGVAAIDTKIANVLMQSDSSSRWSKSMSTFIVGTTVDPLSKKKEHFVLSSQKSISPVDRSARSKDTTPPEFQELFRRIKNRKSGYLDMPYKGVDSIWAYALMFPGQYFVIVVPKLVIMTLPEEVGRMFEGYTRDQTAITGAAVVLALVIVGILALLTAHVSARRVLTIVDAWRRLADGDFSVRLKAPMKDERAQMIDAFNEIVPKIEEHMRMSRALGLAQDVQQSLLPQNDPSFPGFDIAGQSIYCDETGGDYYDFIETNRDGHTGLAVVVGDVSGHGVSSALLMATARALITLRADMPGEAAGIINDVNRYLSLDAAQTGNFMTFFYCELTRDERGVRWVRAGHDPALIYDPSTDTFNELKGQGVALGLDDSFEYEAQYQPLEPGQVLTIGTDGIWEMHDQAGRMFGKEAFMDVIRRFHTSSARQILDAVTQALNLFRGDQAPEDDITMVVIKVDETG